MNGDAFLRIEDIDRNRCKPAYEAGIHTDLAWLGLRWDGEIWRQSERLATYAETIASLRERGLVYRCFRSRQDIASETSGKPDRPFTGTPLPAHEERERLERGDAFAWRLSLAKAMTDLNGPASLLHYQLETDAGLRSVPAEPARFGDIALTRKDSPVAYHLAACQDDAAQGITHVIRGEDLIDAPHIHTLLQALMGWPRPIYCHHRLLMGADGKKFSKRDRSVTIAALREAGHSVADVKALAGVK